MNARVESSWAEGEGRSERAHRREGARERGGKTVYKRDRGWVRVEQRGGRKKGKGQVYNICYAGYGWS